MNRKIIGICTALVAFAAFALVPAMSSAAALRDTVENKLVLIEPGKKIVAYNEEGSATVLTGNNGLVVECQEAKITGSVHANPGGAAGTIFGTIEDVWFNGTESETRCKSTVGAAKVTIPGMTNEGGKQHWCIKSLPEDEFQVEPHGCTETEGEFTFVITAGGLTCRFKRAANIKGTYTTGDVNNVPVTLKMNDGQEFTRDEPSSFLCPTTGKLSNFLFQMYTDTSETGPAWRPTIDTADPVFITKE
jgi:hypothetical protein